MQNYNLEGFLKLGNDYLKIYAYTIIDNSIFWQPFFEKCLDQWPKNLLICRLKVKGSLCLAGSSPIYPAETIELRQRWRQSYSPSNGLKHPSTKIQPTAFFLISFFFFILAYLSYLSWHSSMHKETIATGPETQVDASRHLTRVKASHLCREFGSMAPG